MSSRRAAPLLRSIRSRHMVAQLCVYGSVLAQTYATITGMTSFPTFQMRYFQQNGAVVAAGYAQGDCMCLDYCVLCCLISRLKCSMCVPL